MEVELPDGRIAEFPDDMTREQINAVLQKQFPPEPDAQSYPDQWLRGSPQRQLEMQRIRAQEQSGEITTPEAVFQKIGEGFGNVQDVVGRGMGDVVGGAYGFLPQNTRESIESRLAPIGEALLPVAQGIGDVYGDIKEAQPRLMENVEAGANIGMGVAPLIGRSKQIGESVARSGQAIGQKFLPKPQDLSAEDLKRKAGELYQYADERGGVLRPQITNSFVNDVMKEIPQTEMGKAVIGETPVSKLIERINVLRDKPMTLQAAQEIDEALGELAYGNMNSVTGQLDKQGLKFLNIQSKFRNAIENAPESMVIGGKEGFDVLKDAGS
jgi:hypothetical protein